MKRDFPLEPTELFGLDEDSLTDYINALVRDLRAAIPDECATAGCIDRRGSRRDLFYFASREGHTGFVAALEAAIQVARRRRRDQQEGCG